MFFFVLSSNTCTGTAIYMYVCVGDEVVWCGPAPTAWSSTNVLRKRFRRDDGGLDCRTTAPGLGGAAAPNLRTSPAPLVLWGAQAASSGGGWRNDAGRDAAVYICLRRTAFTAAARQHHDSPQRWAMTTIMLIMGELLHLVKRPIFTKNTLETL